MYRHTVETHDSRRTVLSPSWGAILAAGTAAVVGPLIVMIVISSPGFGVGILAGTILSYAVQNVRRIRARFVRHDPRVVLRAVRPDRIGMTLTEPSNTDGREP